MTLGHSEPIPAWSQGRKLRRALYFRSMRANSAPLGSLTAYAFHFSTLRCRCSPANDPLFSYASQPPNPAQSTLSSISRKNTLYGAQSTPYQIVIGLTLLTQNRLNILHGGTLACMTDLGGSLAVASRGLFATGVSTDLSGTHVLNETAFDH